MFTPYTQTQLMARIGDTLTYVVRPDDLGVSLRVTGSHRGYSMVGEGSAAGPGGPWTKLPHLLFALPGGRYEQAPGAYQSDTPNDSRYFAVDTRHPVPLTHVRFRVQQWFGVEGNALSVAAAAMPTPPKAAADTGGAVAFDELKGVILVVPPGSRAAGAGATAAGHVGGDYRQLLVGVNVTAATLVTDPARFLCQTKGADGVWYTLWESPPVTTPPWQAWTSVGAALAVSHMFGNMVRLAWDVPAGADLVFSASVMAKTLPP